MGVRISWEIVCKNTVFNLSLFSLLFFLFGDIFAYNGNSFHLFSDVAQNGIMPPNCSKFAVFCQDGVLRMVYHFAFFDVF